jgi:hypothetical protein
MEVPDVFRMQSLMVLPSMRTPLAVPTMPPQHRLAPIEMATHSIHISNGHHPQQNPMSHPQPQPSSSTSASNFSSACWSALDPHNCTTSSHPSTPGPAGVVVLDFSARFIPLAYVACLLYLSVSSVLTPGYMRTSIHILSPSWILLVALHAISQNDPVARWTGALVVLLLPFVLLIHNTLFIVFYTLVFAAFASTRFWVSLHGVFFILVSLCWFCILTATALGVSHGGDHTRTYLSTAVVFSLLIAILNSAYTIPKNAIVRFTLA